MTLKYESRQHFHPGSKEVTFLLGEREITQRASLGVMIRVEGKFGPAAPLIGRLVQQQVSIREIIELLRLILAAHADLPKGEAAWAEAIEPIGVRETGGAIVAFLSYGLASEMPPPEDDTGNASPPASPPGD